MAPLTCLSAVMAWSAMPAATTRMDFVQPRTALVAMSVPDDISKSGYLVWDDGFKEIFFVSVAAFAGVAATLSFNEIAVQATISKLSTLGWGALGLLSSACCLFQLILNAMSVGCAGFNTVLGPFRPYFLAFAAVLQAWVWTIEVDARVHGAPADASVVVGSLLCVSLSFLPEALSLWVARRGGEVATSDDGAVLMLRVIGMGCTACTAKVQDALAAVPGVAAAAVDLEAESATLRLDGSYCEVDVREEAVKALDAAGFGAKIN
uniref:HMA domain-containing protein n=1 Tax=Coccolithus braarudii TaxID=221442 RepID=A0A7S0Q4C2_9EUKA|mmetsp:Transcript_40802/g.87022  ORF Transcript_40802/g.87022 Transcript_40802/m.87022 type:complete len:264 (+) Transcript_40802:15-806(+)|eukprot:CAMPEP_0183347768 /NCGR_PEP_ID=MMETSP0164_2-20130417/12486_1 /TAXON_ID=221442 /ORGANISM="Coccolithus pelagicus ssp braarudi, Strain PLY182g" /LENGTH=263 /DNA_ID=CAMNT_0025519251 /DNA_START=15 /DNA_END=806 /DNA_ORIENTATION=-